MKRAIITALTVILAGPVQVKAASIVCDPTCRDPTETISSSTANANAASLSGAKATGAIAGTQVNAPISSSSSSQGGSADVTVINTTSNKVSNRSSNRSYGGGRNTGGGYSGYSHRSSAVASTSDPATAAADPPGPPLGSIQNPLSEQIGGTQTLRNVPEIIAPNISGGNPCLVGVSGGGAGPGIGITLGFGYSDKGCERRNDAAVLNNIGEKAAAIQLMCQDPHVKEAMAAAGQPCAGAVPVAIARAAPAVDPAIVRRQQDIPAYPPTEVAAYPPIPQPKVIPDWCYTASAAEMRAHPQCQGH